MLKSNKSWTPKDATDAKIYRRVIEDAQRAWDAGNTVFAPQIDSGGETDQGPVIEVIEGIGWKLEHWAVAVPKLTLEFPAAFPVFRR